MIDLDDGISITQHLQLNQNNGTDYSMVVSVLLASLL